MNLSLDHLIAIRNIPVTQYLDDLIITYENMKEFNFLECENTPIATEDPKLYHYDYIKKRNEGIIVNIFITY